MEAVVSVCPKEPPVRGISLLVDLTMSFIPAPTSKVTALLHQVDLSRAVPWPGLEVD
jgi:hypothetical protein